MTNIFGERLKKLRKEKGLTQGQLVDMVNQKYGTAINRTTISKWENGTQETSMSFVVMFADFFNVTLDYINGTQNNSNKNSVSDKDIMFALFGGDENITPEMYEEVKRFAQYVKDREKSSKD